jgi:DNA-binding XRE family transcriptional regulator
MDLEAKNEERKRKNAPFLSAFEHVRNELGMTNRDLCLALDVKPQRMTEWKNGAKPVPEPVKYALIQLSVEKEIGQISIDYLDGYTDIMLLGNIPDDELAEIKLRRSNPDYEKIKERQRKKENQMERDMQQSVPSIDPSSQQNASISAYIQLANRLDADIKRKEIEMRERLAEKDDTIENQKARIVALERTIADKDAIIDARDAEIVELKRKLAAIATSDIERYPFAIGAAEEDFGVKRV